MSLLKTIDVTFQGKEYKIRKNMLTLHLFQQELKKNDAMKDEVLSTMIFAYCALKGFNQDFKGDLEYVMMHIDEPDNESLLVGIAELFKDDVPEDKEIDEKK